jgi:hypothetical protein
MGISVVPATLSARRVQERGRAPSILAGRRPFRWITDTVPSHRWPGQSRLGKAAPLLAPIPIGGDD